MSSSYPGLTASSATGNLVRFWTRSPKGLNSQPSDPAIPAWHPSSISSRMPSIRNLKILAAPLCSGNCLNRLKLPIGLFWKKRLLTKSFSEQRIQETVSCWSLWPVGGHESQTHPQVCWQSKTDPHGSQKWQWNRSRFYLKSENHVLWAWSEFNGSASWTGNFIENYSSLIMETAQ